MYLLLPCLVPTTIHSWIFKGRVIKCLFVGCILHNTRGLEIEPLQRDNKKILILPTLTTLWKLEYIEYTHFPWLQPILPIFTCLLISLMPSMAVFFLCMCVLLRVYLYTYVSFCYFVIFVMGIWNFEAKKFVRG